LICGDYHTVIYGATRSGKTRTLLLPTMCMQMLSGADILCSDPKGELYLYTYPFAQRLGYKTYALDFKEPEKSIHYNFLQFIINALEENKISKAIQYTWDFVDALVQEPKGNVEPLWTNGEKALMAAAVMQVVYDNSTNGLKMQYINKNENEIKYLYKTVHCFYQNCTNLFNYISKMSQFNPKTERLLLEDIIDVLPIDHPSKMIMAIAESAPSKMRGSFITSALTSLRLFTDPNISAMTSSTDADILNLDCKKVIYMIVPDGKSTYYSLVSLFTNQYYQYIADSADKQGGRLTRSCEFDLDEFGNFSKMPNLDIKITVAAGRNIHFNLFIQSKEQLVEKYGQEITKIVLDNCHFWIYLKSGGETCDMISQKLGKYTVESSSSSSSLNNNGLFATPTNSGSTSTS
ncbi:MAG: type IV secretory system conjugative DNA transfer family protein, partial [Oscillospiraceae bacterium]